MKESRVEKRVSLPKNLFERLKIEKEKSGINANTIIILALDDYLKKKEKDNK